MNPPPTATPNARCPRCGIPFSCGAASPGRCWCATDFPPAMPLPATGAPACYCPACLRLAISEAADAKR